MSLNRSQPADDALDQPITSDLDGQWEENRAPTSWFRMGREQALVVLLGLLGLGVALAVWTVTFHGADGLEIRNEQSLAVTVEPTRMNVNTAPWYDLALLPGLGEKKARAVVEYRQANGPFATVEALQEVKGIGPKVVAKLKPLVTVKDGKQVPGN